MTYTFTIILDIIFSIIGYTAFGLFVAGAIKKNLEFGIVGFALNALCYIKALVVQIYYIVSGYSSIGAMFRFIVFNFLIPMALWTFMLVLMITAIKNDSDKSKSNTGAQQFGTGYNNANNNPYANNSYSNNPYANYNPNVNNNPYGNNTNSYGGNSNTGANPYVSSNPTPPTDGGLN